MSVPYSCEALSHLSSAFCISVSPSFGLSACQKNWWNVKDWWNVAKCQYESAKIGKFSHVANSYFLASFSTFSQDTWPGFVLSNFQRTPSFVYWHLQKSVWYFLFFYQVSFICLKSRNITKWWGKSWHGTTDGGRVKVSNLRLWVEVLVWPPASMASGCRACLWTALCKM